MKNRLFTILLVTVLVAAVTSDHDDHRDDYHDHDDHHDDGRHHDDDDDDHHHGDGGGRRRFIIKGKIKFPGAPRDYRLTPHKACIHVFVRENILCDGEYCDIPEAAHEIIYGTDIHVDRNYEMSFRFKSERFRSSQYSISAIFNVKRCRRRGVFIAGDYLSKTSNSFVVPSNLNRITVNPIVLEVGDSDNDGLVGTTLKPDITGEKTDQKSGTHDESKTGKQNKDKKKNFLIIGFGIFAFLLLVVILLVIKIKYQMCCNGKPVKPVSPKKKFSLTFDAFPVEKITTKENIYIDNPTDIPPFLPHSYEFPVEMEEDQPPPYRSRESSIRSRPPSYREINREAIYLDKVDYVMFNIPQKKDEN